MDKVKNSPRCQTKTRSGGVSDAFRERLLRETREGLVHFAQSAERAYRKGRV